MGKIRDIVDNLRGNDQGLATTDDVTFNKEILSSGSSGASVNTNADELFIESSGNAGITIATPNTSTGSLNFGDPEDNNAGAIAYNHSTNEMSISSNGAIALTIDSTSNTAFSGGIYLSGGNTLLDDYEEGTWTPTFGLIATPTYVVQEGVYTKIGRLVYCKVKINVSNIDNADTSGINFTVPFTAATGGGKGGVSALVTIDRLGSSLLNTTVFDGAYCTTSMFLTQEDGTNLLYSEACNTSGVLHITFQYMV